MKKESIKFGEYISKYFNSVGFNQWVYKADPSQVKYSTRYIYKKWIKDIIKKSTP